MEKTSRKLADGSKLDRDTKLFIIYVTLALLTTLYRLSYSIWVRFENYYVPLSV